ncbi:hypothetical protein M422DRAFT_259620 [Sphaerobolus stellatus SS14]|uniref:Uncharacterized protein n=1 Tax=Sphaerobolus stellatus (strain SS14) TaxID=990650 RepID=A0A0C9VK16_SPHS4|nr:hypothetical protein M422DRAFT_259620 [Sphaerobolus stellatus SS14]
MPSLDPEQLRMKDAKNARCRDARHHQTVSVVLSTAVPQQAIAGPSHIPFPPITRLALPHDVPLYHSPPSTRHTPGKCSRITAHATPPHDIIRQMSPVHPWRHNSDVSMDTEEGEIILPQRLFAEYISRGVVSSDGPDDVFSSTPLRITPVPSPGASLPPSSAPSSPPHNCSETPPLFFPESPTSIV